MNDSQPQQQPAPGPVVTRIGEPIDVELHDAGTPEAADIAVVAHTLTDMAKDFEFFTTAVIYGASLFDRDPVEEFLHMCPGSPADTLMVIDAEQPFFSGIGVVMVAGVPVNMDRRLYAIRREHWSNLRDFISGIAMIHQATNFFAKLAFYELSIVDQFKLKMMSVVPTLPMVPVTVFAVSSNKAFAYLDPRVYPSLPTLVREPPKPDIQQSQVEVLSRVHK